jgi:hypothetical protein
MRSVAKSKNAKKYGEVAQPKLQIGAEDQKGIVYYLISSTSPYFFAFLLLATDLIQNKSVSSSKLSSLHLHRDLSKRPSYDPHHNALNQERTVNQVTSSKPRLAQCAKTFVNLPGLTNAYPDSRRYGEGHTRAHSSSSLSETHLKCEWPSLPSQELSDVILESASSQIVFFAIMLRGLRARWNQFKNKCQLSR